MTQGSKITIAADRRLNVSAEPIIPYIEGDGIGGPDIWKATQKILDAAVAKAYAGGLGMAPGANIGDTCAVFEATHGTAPKYAGLNKVNPGSLVLSGAMMLEHMGWSEAAALVRGGLIGAIQKKQVTYDLARQMAGAEEVSCSAFAEVVVASM